VTPAWLIETVIIDSSQILTRRPHFLPIDFFPQLGRIEFKQGVFPDAANNKGASAHIGARAVIIDDFQQP
jgi:hypothetical protein